MTVVEVWARAHAQTALARRRREYLSVFVFSEVNKPVTSKVVHNERFFAYPDMIRNRVSRAVWSPQRVTRRAAYSDSIRNRVSAAVMLTATLPCRMLSVIVSACVWRDPSCSKHTS